jgi:hypothetical protein
MDDPNGDRLTVRELIRLELQGKAVAAGWYNNILMRIRGGYVLVLYGSLLLFAGKENALSVISSNQTIALTSFITILILSGILAILDISYRVRQLRVVVAFNQLMDFALGRATDKDTTIERLGPLLHIVGDSRLSIGISRYFTAVVLIGSLYIAIPLLGFVLYMVVPFEDRT